MGRRTVLVLVLALGWPVAAGIPAAQTPALPNAPDSVKFLAMGDSGTGGSRQYELARRMVEARARFPFTFAIMMGDNIYGDEDPEDFEKKFERPYKPLLDAGVDFHAALGNHDESNQRFYKLFNMDGERYYTFERGSVRFFALDSTYVDAAQLAWLEKALAASDARWNIAFFHHPIYSSGKRHGSELDLRALVEPLLVKYGVDVVFAGHEHFYERVRPQRGIHYFTTGAAAKLRRGNIAAGSPLTAAGYDQDNSFMLVEVAGDVLHFEVISRKGAVVDAGAIERPADPPPAGQPTR